MQVTDASILARHVAVELSADKSRQMWIYATFTHGFCTPVDDCGLILRVTSSRARCSHDGRLLWLVSAAGAHVPDGNRAPPHLIDLESFF